MGAIAIPALAAAFKWHTHSRYVEKDTCDVAQVHVNTNLEEIKSRLISIEEFLRNGK